jgi:hypothetical protein
MHGFAVHLLNPVRDFEQIRTHAEAGLLGPREIDIELNIIAYRHQADLAAMIEKVPVIADR